MKKQGLFRWMIEGPELVWLQSDLQYNNVDEKRKCKM